MGLEVAPQDLVHELHIVACARDEVLTDDLLPHAKIKRNVESAWQFRDSHACPHIDPQL